MSLAMKEAVMFSVMGVILVGVFIHGLRRRNTWRYAAPIGIVYTAVLVYFNLHGYVFGGPGVTVHPPADK